MEWERRKDESDEAFAAFSIYLTQERVIKKVAEQIGKSVQLLYRWSSKYDWRGRATAYDNSLIEELRSDTRRQLAKRYRKILSDVISFQDAAAGELRRKDLSRASVTSLTELYAMAKDTELAIMEILKTNEPAREMEIKLVGV